MKLSQLIIVCLSVVIGGLAQAHLEAGLGVTSTPVSVHGFKEWKAIRVEEARKALERFQGDLQQDIASHTERLGATKPNGSKAGDNSAAQGLVTPPARPMRSPRPDQRLQQARLNFEIAQEFTVNDYFVLYLSQFKDRDAYVEASKKITPEEMGDLLMSFRKPPAGVEHSETVPPVVSRFGVTTQGASLKSGN